jgi:hypothetical protein
MAIAAAHPSHHFVADFDADNMECAECYCRPYGGDELKPCPGNQPRPTARRVVPAGDPYWPSKPDAEYPNN